MQEKIKLSKSQGASTPAELKRMQNVSYASAVGSIMYTVRCTRPDVAFAQNVTSQFQQIQSAKQSIFATSSAEAEYIAAFDASKEAGINLMVVQVKIEWRQRGGKKDAEDLGNEDNEVLSTEEPRINEEKDANVNNTNNINTISPTANAFSTKDNAVDENIVYGYADDPNMPNLEEIVYSDDDEDVGAEVNMTNLDTNITVSPIPTIRIHKDHPVKQIIGDIHSAPQTRRITKSVTDHDNKYTYGDFKALMKDENAKDVDVHLYRSMIGSLMYLTSSRHDIMFATVDLPFSQDLKSSHDDGSKPSSDDGKKFDEDPRKESECKDQEKEDNVNCTNNVNIVSSTINVACTNEDNELPFDSNMPALEDVSIFNFSSDDEDDDIVADMNNLDTTIHVSPIPTTRIHKDHPIDQVIRDLQSATQTRKMSKNLEEHGLVSPIQQRPNHKDLQNFLLACFLLQEEPKKAYTYYCQLKVNVARHKLTTAVDVNAVKVLGYCIGQEHQCSGTDTRKGGWKEAHVEIKKSKPKGATTTTTVTIPTPDSTRPKARGVVMQDVTPRLGRNMRRTIMNIITTQWCQQ
nr:hypothetical protein [Tanacetum cinerariifolium]